MKVLRDINIQCDNVVEARRSDIVVTEKNEQKGMIIDTAVPAGVRVGGKKRESEISRP